MRTSWFSSVQGRLGLIFLAFLLLLIISVSVTFSGLAAQNQDARIINLAGRQRMLLQQINDVAVHFELEGESSSSAELSRAADSFEQTLAGFRSGGQIRDYTGETLQLAPPADPALITELNAQQKDWQIYRAKINQLLQNAGSPNKGQIVDGIEGLTPALTDQADQVVRIYESISNQKAASLRVYQLSFLIAGLALLSAGWWVVRRSIVSPLSHLEKSAQRIGDGDLSTSIQASGPAEVRLLGNTMQTMQSQILASRQDLQQWAETLESRVQQRTRELEALAAVSQEINSHLSLNEVLSSVTNKALALLGAEIASLCLLDSAGQVLNLHATAGPEVAILKNQSPADSPLVEGLLGQHSARPCGLHSCQGFCAIIAPGYRASHMAAPLYARGKVIGALCVGSARPGAFRSEMVTVLTQLSDVASVAIENSRLYQQAEYAAALEERQRIASEMHDGLLQTLSFIRLMARLSQEHLGQNCPEKALTTLQKIEQAEEQAEREIRQAVSSLQYDFPHNDTLQESLSVLANELSAASPVVFETRLVIPLVLPHQENEQVLRVVREAVLNAQRYSQAGRVSVTLDKNADELSVTVCDQGVGFDPGAAPQDGRPHFGLKIMEARAARLGGKLSVQSSPGAGTAVRLSWLPSSSHLN